MTDVSELINRIVSDPKIANNSNFADKIYRDEPILITAPQMKNYTPHEIREMRKLARASSFDALTFYRQAAFMESYEDEFDYRGEFVQYFPTYQHMTDQQLRGYFSWRTKVRAGVVGRTSLSFAFVYIYELLNRIGVSTPLDGFHALKNFWAAYRQLDPRLNSYVQLWLKDYVVYHSLDVSLLEGFPDAAFDKSLAILLDYKAYGSEDIFAALNAVSAYKMEKSRFFKQHPDEVKDVVRQVFSVISDYHNRNPKNSAQEKFFGRIVVSFYSMFNSAVFYEPVVPHDRAYEIGNNHRYVCRLGSWRCERFLWYGYKNKRIGALLKTIDFLMRQEYGFNSTLQIGKTNKVLTAKIAKEITKYRHDQLKAVTPEITIDTSKLQQIRHTALVTQNKLLVNEAVDEREIQPEAAAETGVPESENRLTDIESQFVHRLLRGEPYAGLVQSRSLMLSVLVDGINEKLFDAFGDTVISDDGVGPVVIEDYREELKGMVAQ